MHASHKDSANTIFTMFSVRVWCIIADIFFKQLKQSTAEADDSVVQYKYLNQGSRLCMKFLATRCRIIVSQALLIFNRKAVLLLVWLCCLVADIYFKM